MGCEGKGMNNSLLIDDSFTVFHMNHTLNNKVVYFFEFKGHTAQEAFSEWYWKKGLRDFGDVGFTKAEVIEVVSYLKEKNIKLSLETEMWLVKNVS